MRLRDAAVAAIALGPLGSCLDGANRPGAEVYNLLDYGLDCADGGSGQDDAAITALLAAIPAADNKRAAIYLPPSTGPGANSGCVVDYSSNDGITFGSDGDDRFALVFGAGPRLSKIDYTGTGCAFVLTGGSGIAFRDFSIELSASSTCAFENDTGNYNEFTRLLIEGTSSTGIGFDFDGASCGCHNRVTDVYFAELATGIRLANIANQNTFTHLTFASTVTTALSIDSDRNVFVAADCESGGTCISLGANASKNVFMGGMCDSVTTCITAAAGNDGNAFFSQGGSVAITGTGAAAPYFYASSSADPNADIDTDRTPP